MIDLKPYGGFIENTIRPLIGEAKWFLNELDRQGIKINEDTIMIITHDLIKLHFITLGAEIVKTLGTTAIICFTLWTMSRYSSLF